MTFTRNIVRSCLLLFMVTSLASVAEARPVAVVKKVIGNAFVFSGKSFSKLTEGKIINDFSEVTTEIGSQVTRMSIG